MKKMLIAGSAVAALFAVSPAFAEPQTPPGKSGAATDTNSGPSQKMAPQAPSTGAAGRSSGEVGSSAPPPVADPDATKSDSGKMHPDNPASPSGNGGQTSK